MKEGYTISDGDKVKLLRYKIVGCKIISKPQIVEYIVSIREDEDEYGETWQETEFYSDKLDSSFETDLDDGDTIRRGNIYSDDEGYDIIFTDNELDLWSYLYHSKVYDIMNGIKSRIDGYNTSYRLNVHSRKMRLYMRMIKKLKE